MATTQQRSTGGSNVVLKPLNIGRTPQQPRTKRRSADQVREARIARDQNLADKAQKRVDSIKNRMQRAQDRADAAKARALATAQEAERKLKEEQEAAQRAAEEAAAIATQAQGTGPVKVQRGTSAAKTVPAVEMTPEIDKMIRNITKDFGQFFKHVEEKYGVQFDYAESETGKAVPTLVKRGFISVRLRGNLPATKTEVEHASTSELTLVREMHRFMKYHREVGLTQSWLNKEVKIKDDPNTYRVTGLRGKAHSVVLRRVNDNQAFTMSATDLKAAVVS